MTQSKKHLGMALVVGSLWAVIFCPVARSGLFAGGTGEPNDPYQIATAAQLIVMGSDPNLLKKHYVLTASIDLGGTPRSTPVIFFFRGTFDGDGHAIRNLNIDGSGLFLFIESGAEVRNLGVVNVQVRDLSDAGALASENWGRVVNCYSTGAVVGAGNGAGGLLGLNLGTVANSYSTASVGGGHFTGGLVGQNVGVVSDCYSTGEVSGMAWVGGLVGNNMGEIAWSHCISTVTGLLFQIGGLVGDNGGKITYCYAEATVTGQYDDVGGLVGANGGSISSCYWTGNVTGQGRVGGLAGSNDGVVSCCYSAGRVTGQERAGGLVGANEGAIAASYSVAAVDCWGWYVGGLAGTGPAKDCYFLAPEDGGGPDNGVGTPLSDAEMRRQASFAGWDFWGTTADGAADSWFMPANAYPVLPWQTEITGLKRVPDVAGLPLNEARAALVAAGFVVGAITYDFDRAIPAGCVIVTNPHSLSPLGAAVDLVVSFDGTYSWAANPGDGSAANPYQIETAGQLESLGDHPELWSKHFVLVADVDMTGRAYATALMAPDTDHSRTGFQGTPFTGAFDGQDHAIRNLTVKGGNQHDYVGLFGMIGPAGRIDNLRLLDVDIEGYGSSSQNSYVGALAGYNAGIVAHCSATGILHRGQGDGMVGFNSGSLIDCDVDVMRL
jgi:hypothetical protein